MIDTKSVEGLIFLSYITNYNLQEIHRIIEQERLQPIENNYTYNFTEKALFETRRTVDIVLEKLKFYDIKAIPFYSKAYPKQLKSLKDFPPILYFKGKLKKGKFCAIVGSREASKIAERKVTDIARVFINGRFGIVSGLAYGIDTFAHRAAINLKGYTIAVMPTSLDTIYPLENFGLANEILKNGGALVSEIPIGINRGRKSFIERNRIQVSFSEFVTPIEMGVNSGTMHTVNFCIQQNKNLLLPIPTSATEAMYKSFYEGIKFLEMKYKDKPRNNVFYVHSIIELKELLGYKEEREKVINESQQQFPF